VARLVVTGVSNLDSEERKGHLRCLMVEVPWQINGHLNLNLWVMKRNVIFPSCERTWSKT